MASETSYTCTATYTTGTTTVDYTPQYIGLIQKFSAIQFTIHGTINGTTSENDSLSYLVTSSSGGIYSVNFTIISASGTEQAAGKVDANNNTVLSMTFSGYTFGGSLAKTEFDGLMALFGLEETYGNQLGIFTASQYFHSTGTSSQTFGTATFDVTTYVANSLPMTVSDCGVNSTITDYSLQVGTPPGTTLPFITYLHVATTSPSVEDITFQLVSMTVA